MSSLYHEGIEFIFPGICKAYPREWAENFLHTGEIYFTNLETFKKDEDQQRGDSLEGTSIAIRQGVRCTGGYACPIFVWCSTMETDPAVILDTWKDRNAVVQITDTLGFARRIRDVATGLKLLLQVGPITYDKDEGNHREYDWAEGIFQKNIRFNPQKEYRFALVGDANTKKSEKIILKLGDCNDLARIL
ncbi:MAG: hypothetical protein CVU55_13775 [Deltaproteobacteria bacterium HGW-Deltaproteobacteria-13]|jgi:hypothetical protein|nr:MAG: hypothetical protein CVU55_13775 [Deltaproteobacteria bacterium HGW-Deltaproteobacteria-13]